MDRYIGMDVHSASCTAGVMSAKGRRLKSVVLETNGTVLVEFLKTIPSKRHLIIEEGTHSNWLYEILSPHVHEMTVIGVPKNKGQKNDKLDSFGLAEKLRIGSIETRVYKGAGNYASLDATSKAYRNVMIDSVRVMNRLKGVFRSRGIPTGDKEIFSQLSKDKWIAKLPSKIRPLAKTYYAELDVLMELRRQAQKEMRKEARKHKIYRVLRTVPGMGPNRVAELLPIVVTPYRFPNKRMFWTYCGLGVVMRSSSDWVRAADGSWIRTNTQQTRGLNYNHNHFLKNIFKGAATTVIGQKRENDPVFQHYLSLLENGTKPPLAKLTIARQIASITLSILRTGEEYDAKKTEKEITRFQIGTIACESIGNWQRDIWRRKGFRGEYHLFGWSQPIVLESPCVGYAPLESQIKQWAEESRIEGWFPHLAGERNCCNVIGCAEDKLPSDREQTRYPWLKLQTPWTSSHRIFDVNQLVKLVAVDAGCKTNNVQRTGDLRLDTLPHRKPNKAPFSVPHDIFELCSNA